MCSFFVVFCVFSGFPCFGGFLAKGQFRVAEGSEAVEKLRERMVGKDEEEKARTATAGGEDEAATEEGEGEVQTLKTGWRVYRNGFAAARVGRGGRGPRSYKGLGRSHRAHKTRRDARGLRRGKCRDR